MTFVFELNAQVWKLRNLFVFNSHFKLENLKTWKLGQKMYSFNSFYATFVGSKITVLLLIWFLNKQAQLIERTKKFKRWKCKKPESSKLTWDTSGYLCTSITMKLLNMSFIICWENWQVCVPLAMCTFENLHVTHRSHTELNWHAHVIELTIPEKKLFCNWHSKLDEGNFLQPIWTCASVTR